MNDYDQDFVDRVKAMQALMRRSKHEKMQAIRLMLTAAYKEGYCDGLRSVKTKTGTHAGYWEDSETLSAILQAEEEDR